MSNPLVSIIVPVFKVEQYIKTCINSVQAQSYNNWEMILVDDGSPDKCGEICDEYAGGDCRIIVIHTQNGGPSCARNHALDYPPKGEFVTFLDSDDFWHPDYLRNLVDLQQKYKADIIQCGFLRGVDSVFPKQQNQINIEVFDNHEVFLKEKAEIVMWGKLYRTRMFEGIRMPVGLYNEDDWTTWKLYYQAKTVAVTSQALYYYTKNPISTMSNLKKKPDLRYINAYNERIDFFVKTGEKDLEDTSRLQLCKSLLLIYSHRQLSIKERQDVKDKFDESWHRIKNSSFIRVFYKFLFTAFHVMPLLTSTIVGKLR